MPMPICPSGTRTLMTLISASLPAIASHRPCVGLNTVPSATSPATNGQPSVPAVANLQEARGS